MFKTLKVFYSFFFQKKLLLFVFWFFIILSPIVSSVTPYFYKLFIDNLATSNIEFLTRILIFFIAIKFLDIIVHVCSFMLSDIIAIDLFPKIYLSIFKHVHLLDFSFHTKKSSGSLISIFKRGEGAFWNLYHSLHHRVVDVFVRFIVMIWFFANIDMRFITFAFVAFILCLLIAIVFVKFNIIYRRQVNEKEDEISGVVVDNMINFETVKLFSNEVWEEERLRKIWDKWKTPVWKYVLSFRSLDIGMGTVINLATFAILLYSLNLTLAGSLTLGDFVLVATFIQLFFNHLFELVWGLRDIAKHFSDIEKFLGVLEFEVEVKDPPNPKILKNVKGEITFNKVTFTYEKNTRNAVKDIDLNIRQGQSVALVGRSGSGKTTLAKLLLRFFDVNKGKITIDGIDIRDITKDNLRQNFGVVPQEPILFNNSVAYNITYGKQSASKKEVIAAAKMANIHKFIRSLPDKYETQVGERGIKLSGGQKQRLAIARMILSDPQIIIFDEATSQLDSESEKLIQNAFWKASKGKTTIIIAHRLSTIQKADKIIVMDKGEIVEEGSHKSLLENDESLYNHFWNLQIKLT